MSDTQKTVETQETTLEESVPLETGKDSSRDFSDRSSLIGTGSVSPSKGKKVEAERFKRDTTATKLLKLNIDDIILRPYGEENKKICLRPGGNFDKPKELVRVTVRKATMKKVGQRKEYTISQIMSVRHMFKKVPVDVEIIQDILEEGLGEDVGIELEVSNIKNKMKAERNSESKFINSNQQKNIDNNNNINNIIKINNNDNNNKIIDNEIINKKTTYNNNINVNEKQINEIENNISNEKEFKPSVPSLRKPTNGKVFIPSHLRSKQHRDPMREFRKQITSILNKITLDNFNILSKQIISVFETHVNSSHKLKELVQLIFTKTIDEPEFSKLYSDLCVELSKKDREFEDINGNKVNFRNALILVCHSEFEKGPNYTLNKSQQEIEKHKKQMINTMEFIGQLYLVDLLNIKIMSFCFTALLSDNNNKEPNEENIERACTLFRCIGQKLDQDTKINKQQIQKFYKRLFSFKSSEKYPARIRILIKNLEDDKKSKWQETKKNVLQTTQQVQLQHEKSKGKQVTKVRTNEDKETLVRMLETGSIGFHQAFGDDNDIIHDNKNIDSNNGKLRVFSRYGNENKNNNVIDNNNNNNNNNINNINNQNNVNNFNNDKISKKNLNTKIPSLLSGSSTLFNLNNNNNNNNNNRRMQESIDISDNIPRPGQNGPKLEEEKFREIFKEYLVSKLNESGVMTKLVDHTIDPNQILEISFRIALDRNESQQERTTILWQSLIKKRFIIQEELELMLNEFFEEYTSEQMDNPKLAIMATRMLAPLFISKDINMNCLNNWLTKDPGMKKPCKPNPKLSKQLEFIGNLFKEIKAADVMGDPTVVSKLIQPSNFDLTSYLSDDLKEEFMNTFRLKWFFKTLN